MLFLLGEHKRMGALDVCPFIPVQGVTMEDCVQCAKNFGERAAKELGIPGTYIKYMYYMCQEIDLGMENQL